MYAEAMSKNYGQSTKSKNRRIGADGAEYVSGLEDNEDPEMGGEDKPDYDKTNRKHSRYRGRDRATRDDRSEYISIEPKATLIPCVHEASMQRPAERWRAL